MNAASRPEPASLASRTTMAIAICWATSALSPAAASRLTWGATPGGKRRVGRQRRPSRATGHSTVSTRDSTPRVVPTLSTSSAARGNPAISIVPPSGTNAT